MILIKLPYGVSFRRPPVAHDLTCNRAPRYYYCAGLLQTQLGCLLYKFVF
jgi:hypothetical protein